MGNIPTYEAFRQGVQIATHIDVTLSRGDVMVQNWGVDQGYNASDHNTIRWDTMDEKPPTPLIRPWHKAKWDVFTAGLQNAGLHIPDVFTEKKVDRMLARLMGAIRGALDKACPLQEPAIGGGDSRMNGTPRTCGT